MLVLMLRIILANLIILFSLSSTLNAQAILKISPSVNAINIFNDTSENATYTVTNNTNKVISDIIINPTYNISPILNEATINLTSNSCANINLAPNASCTFGLQIVGTRKENSTSFVITPRVCAYKDAICSTTPISAYLSVEVSALAQLVITNPVPPNLIFSTLSTATMTIQNISTVTYATNVTADFTGTALAGNVTATTCARIAPGASCTITFTAGSASVTQTSFPIRGDMSTIVFATINTIIPLNIKITAPNPPKLILNLTNSSGTMTIKNTSKFYTATNVMASFANTDLENNVIASSCASIAPNATCTMIFNLTTQGITTLIPETSFTIFGDNTSNYVIGYITIATPSQLTLNPSNLVLTQGGPGGNITVTNNGTVTAQNITATLPASLSSIVNQTGNNCPALLGIDQSCTLTFTPIFGGSKIVATPITIQAVNSTTANATIQVVATYAYVVNNKAGTAFPADISVCTVNPIDGHLTACSQQNTLFTTFKPTGIALSADGKYAYVTYIGGPIKQCTINRDTGLLSNCNDTASGISISNGIAVAPSGLFAYIIAPRATGSSQRDVFTCNVNSITGNLNNCVRTPNIIFSTNLDVIPIILNSTGSVMLMPNNEELNFTYVKKCTINNDGSIAVNSCAQTDGTPKVVMAAIILNTANTYAYLSYINDYTIQTCLYNETTANISACVKLGATSSENVLGMALSTITTPLYLYGARRDPNGTASDSVEQYPINPINGALSDSVNSVQNFAGPAAIAISH